MAEHAQLQREAQSVAGASPGDAPCRRPASTRSPWRMLDLASPGRGRRARGVSRARRRLRERRPCRASKGAGRRSGADGAAANGAPAGPPGGTAHAAVGVLGSVLADPGCGRRPAGLGLGQRGSSARWSLTCSVADGRGPDARRTARLSQSNATCPGPDRFSGADGAAAPHDCRCRTRARSAARRGRRAPGERRQCPRGAGVAADATPWIVAAPPTTLLTDTSWHAVGIGPPSVVGYFRAGLSLRSASTPRPRPANSCSTSSAPSRTSNAGSSPRGPATASPRPGNAGAHRVDRHSTRTQFPPRRNSSRLDCPPLEPQNSSALAGQRLTESQKRSGDVETEGLRVP